MLWSCKLGKKPGQKLISWVTKPNPTVTIVVKKDSHLFPLNAVNEKLFWSLIFLRVRILLLIFQPFLYYFVWQHFILVQNLLLFLKLFFVFICLVVRCFGFAFVSVWCFLICWREIALMVKEIKDCNADIKAMTNFYTLTQAFLIFKSVVSGAQCSSHPSGSQYLKFPFDSFVRSQNFCWYTLQFSDNQLDQQGHVCIHVKRPFSDQIESWNMLCGAASFSLYIRETCM